MLKQKKLKKNEKKMKKMRQKEKKIVETKGR